MNDNKIMTLRTLLWNAITVLVAAAHAAVNRTTFCRSVEQWFASSASHDAVVC